MELAEKTGLDKLKADVVFLSPPWGGPNYQCKDVFNINTMIPMNGSKLFQTAQKISNDIAYFLPRNVNQNQVWFALTEGYLWQCLYVIII